MPTAKEDSSYPLLDAQRALWAFANGRQVLPMNVLDQVNEQAMEATFTRYERTMRMSSRLINVALPTMTLCLAFVLLFSLMLVAALVVSAIWTKHAIPLAFFAQLLAAVFSAGTLAWIVTSLSERQFQLTVRKRYDDMERAREEGLAWSHLEVENMPALILVEPKTMPGREKLWSHFEGLDRDTVTVLARESNMSIGQLLQAAHRLA